MGQMIINWDQFSSKSFHYFALFFAVFCLSLFSSCGGGGGGGSAPPVVSSPSQPLSSLPTGQEYQAQSGLQQIGVASALQRGWQGQNIKAGIVDSGVASTHSEFTAALRGGGDWQGSGSGLSDPDGHGSHVAGIIGARADGAGMQGVAAQSQMYSFRILNDYGYFGSRTGEQMIPGVVQSAKRLQVRILNNSWASNYEIDDVSKSDIQSSISAELSAWRSAVSDGMVMVWAAGNDGENQVSMRAGLPHYFSELKAGWLSVVSVDSDGREPRYTNRCGLAADWCLTAPGGGDNSASTGIYSVNASGGYTRKSGTSMAAPHVAGALTVVMEAFGGLSAQQAASRLLATAHYNGLVAADGCTLSSCGAARMRAIFGRGQVDLAAALRPISGLNIETSGKAQSFSNSGLKLSGPIYHHLKASLSDHKVKLIDSFDGAVFQLPAARFLQDVQKRPASVQPLTQSQQQMLAFIKSGEQATGRPLNSASLQPFASREGQNMDSVWVGVRGGADSKEGWQLAASSQPGKLSGRFIQKRLLSKRWSWHLTHQFSQLNNHFEGGAGGGAFALGKGYHADIKATAQMHQGPLNLAFGTELMMANISGQPHHLIQQLDHKRVGWQMQAAYQHQPDRYWLFGLSQPWAYGISHLSFHDFAADKAPGYAGLKKQSLTQTSKGPVQLDAGFIQQIGPAIDFQLGLSHRQKSALTPQSKTMVGVRWHLRF
ncbi:MAG: S8 family peptidase [Candidatus Puniceispirillaceae bacterium]